VAFSPRARVTLLVALVFAAPVAFVAYLSYGYWTSPAVPLDLPPPGAQAGAQPAEPVAQPPATTTPQVAPAQGEPPSPDQQPPAAAPPSGNSSPPPGDTQARQAQAPGDPAAAASSATRLVMPVVGVRPEQLTDTFTQSRSEGRAHNAIDIIAPRGTPVRAAVAGRVVKLFRSERGGITLYQHGPDGRTIYYYAHLDRYADGMAEGRELRRGEVIGYVGDTGNATPGNCHLHFQIYVPTDPKSIWDGTPVNPYPLLLTAEP